MDKLKFNRVKPQIEDLIRFSKDDNPQLRLPAIKMLAQLKDKRAVELLIATIKSDTKKEWCHLLAALGSIGTTPAVTFLIEVLHYEASNARFCAVASLGDSKNDLALQPLIEILNSDDATHIRGMAATALGKLGNKNAVIPLIDILKNDPDIHVRDRAIIALGKLRDERAIEPLLVALEDSESVIRYRAVKILGELGDNSALEKLSIISKSDISRPFDDQTIREVALWSIAKITQNNNH
jgi:HEAT repeat protein